jgi:hypothetical protein
MVLMINAFTLSADGKNAHEHDRVRTFWSTAGEIEGRFRPAVEVVWKPPYGGTRNYVRRRQDVHG